MKHLLNILGAVVFGLLVSVDLDATPLTVVENQDVTIDYGNTFNSYDVGCGQNQLCLGYCKTSGAGSQERSQSAQSDG